jgi:hypothetical protein
MNAVSYHAIQNFIKAAMVLSAVASWKISVAKFTQEINSWTMPSPNMLDYERCNKLEDKETVSEAW